MSHEISTFRLYLVRTLYVLMFVGFGSLMWRAILNHKGAWDPLHGVAFCFWVALLALMGVGLRYPLQMLPLIFLQLLYKVVWLIVVAPSLPSVGQSTQLIKIFVIVAAVDLIIIPCPMF